jgi:CheY-like chemotaxis protein
MSIIRGILNRLGLTDFSAPRDPVRIFLLDDDKARHDWFAKHFSGDYLDIAEDVPTAIEKLSSNYYDGIFLDHDLLPEHYNAETLDEEHTGYAVALWLAQNHHVQRAATIIVHTRNADGAMKMVERLRSAGREAEYVPFTFLPQKIKRYWQR